MIGISIAEENEWISAKKYYCVSECIEYPYDEYFNYKLNDKNIILYRCNVRKTSSTVLSLALVQE